MSEPTQRPRTPFARLADLALDAAGLAGAGLITYGAGEIYRPAAFIVAGVFLLAGVWLVAARSG